jgi:hypothetical protein
MPHSTGYFMKKQTALYSGTILTESFP